MKMFSFYWFYYLFLLDLSRIGRLEAELQSAKIDTMFDSLKESKHLEALQSGYKMGLNKSANSNGFQDQQ